MSKRDRALATVRERASAHGRARTGVERAMTLRNVAMRTAYEAGATLAELADAAGISVEAVSKALGRPSTSGNGTVRRNVAAS